MPQAKKKKSTKTAKKPATKACKKSTCRSCSKKSVSPRERMHVYIVTVLSIAAGILLCADAAIMAVA